MGSDADTVRKYILSLDIGTTTIRCFVYNEAAEVVGRCSCPIKILYPEQQAVEIDPNSLWEQVLYVMKGSISDASIKPSMIASMGISSQRGTFILWDKETGEYCHNFIVWQDTRANQLACQWNNSYFMKTIQMGSKTLHTVTQKDRFLAAAVIRFRAQHVSMRLLWVFKNFPNLKRQCEEGKICFATLDTWIIHKLTKGKVFSTEYSCASSTGLYDPYLMEWSGFICGILGIPTKIFPPVHDTSGRFGECDADILGSKIPICAAVGDQQAAMFGECCFLPGDVKLTMGTGAFLDMNVGSNPHTSVAGFYPLIGWKIGSKVVHIAEGCSNTAGNAVDWLISMGIIKEPSASEKLAITTDTSNGVYFVPAFNGLQAPLNDYLACGSIFGITQATKPCHIARAALESLAFRNKQLFETMQSETSIPMKRFVCDGGVSENDFVVQLTTDLIGRKIRIPEQNDMSALGTAFLAGLAVGYWKSESELKDLVKCKKVYNPRKEVSTKYIPVMQQWMKATKRSMNWYAKET